jgi:hypothetical protein
MAETTIADLFEMFLTDRIYNKYSFHPVTVNGEQLFYTSASVEDVFKNVKQFQSLSHEQHGIIISVCGIPELECIFVIDQVLVFGDRLIVRCSVKNQGHLKKRNKNISRLKSELYKRFNIKCEVEIDG